MGTVHLTKKMQVLHGPGECLCEQSFCWRALMTLLTTLKNMKFWPVLAISRARPTRKQWAENILRNRREIVNNHPEIVKQGAKSTKRGSRSRLGPPRDPPGSPGGPKPNSGPKTSVRWPASGPPRETSLGSLLV